MRWFGIGVGILSVVNFGAGGGALMHSSKKFYQDSTDAFNDAMASCKTAVSEFQEGLPNITNTCESGHFFMTPTRNSRHNANYTGDGIEYGGVPLATTNGTVCKVNADDWCSNDLTKKGYNHDPFLDAAWTAFGSGFTGTLTGLAFYANGVSRDHARQCGGLPLAPGLPAFAMFISEIAIVATRAPYSDFHPTQYAYLTTSEKPLPFWEAIPKDEGFKGGASGGEG